jgi:hypothetical protein
MVDFKNKNADALSKISKDRSRTNILKTHEQQLIAYLVQRIPSCISSDMLTAIGFVGSIITFAGFVLATYYSKYWLLLGILGFAINWFGDSLDGRVAYYRNRPRKWYGFTLDLTVDWFTNILIGLGYVFYVDTQWEFIGIGFIMLYGWAMITAILRYKITNKYTIDSGLCGPTEVRIIICLLLILETLIHNAIVYCGLLVCIILLIVNIIDFVKLLKMGDQRDKEERNA